MKKRLALFFATISQAFQQLIDPTSSPEVSAIATRPPTKAVVAKALAGAAAAPPVVDSLKPIFVEMQKVGPLSAFGQDLRLWGICERVAKKMKIPVHDVAEVAMGRSHSDSVLEAIESNSRKTLAGISASMKAYPPERAA